MPFLPDLCTISPNCRSGLLVGAILEVLTPHDFQKSFSFLLIMNSSSFGLVGISNLVGLPPIIGIIILAFLLT